jgi:pilus assembly protein CpaE
VAGETILCVDDDEIILALMKKVLGDLGYRVRTAADGLAALKAVEADPPELVIADVSMPLMNGLELTRRLRASRHTARIPIILLSARNTAQDVLTGYAEGADEYVPKPVDMPVLAAKVHTILQRTTGRAPARSASAPTGKLAVFLHAKGGVGTTTLAVNCAVSLAMGATRAAMLDLNLLFGSVGLLLDVHPPRTLADLAKVSVDALDDATFSKFVVSHETGLRLVASPAAPEEAELVAVSTVQQTLDRLRSQAEYVLVDTAVSFSEVTLAALDAADAICLVTTPHLASLKATREYFQVLDKLQVSEDRVLLVLNRTTPSGLDAQRVAQFLERKPDVLVPYTPLFDEAANEGAPLVARPGHPAGALEVSDLASRLASLAGTAAAARRVA